MLSQMRGALKGAVSWFIIILLILAFALWGVPELRQFTGGSAVEVGDAAFSQNYVQTEFNRAVQSRRAEVGGNFSQADAIAQGLHTQTVDSIATRSALEQFSDKLGLAIPRETVRRYLQETEAFQNPATGKFDQFVLESILQRNGISATEFENRIAEDLKRTQLIGALAAGSEAPNAYVNAILMRDAEQRTISYLTVTDEMSGVPAEPTPPELQEYYEQNPTSFTAPEYRSFDILILHRDEFAEGLEVPDDEIQRLYEINKERIYDQPEKRTLYQITFDTEAEAQAAVASLRQGEPFEALAASRGQTLDSVTFTDALQRDVLDPSVAEAAFDDALEEGSIVEPVRSLFGWTVIQVAGITPPETKLFEEVRDEITADFLENDTRRALLNAIDAIEEERDTGASLAVAAEGAGYKVESFGPVDRYSFAPGGAIIDNIPGQVLGEVFRLDEGDESEALEYGDDEGYYFVSLKEITPPALMPFDEVQDEVEQLWRKNEQENRISNTVSQIRESIEGGQSLAEAAAPFERAPIEQTLDKRFQSEVLSTSFVDQVFYATKGAVVSGPTASGASQVVAVINDIQYPRGISPDQQALYRQYVGYQLDQELLEAFVTGVRDDLGVKINQSQLDVIFGQAQ